MPVNTGLAAKSVNVRSKRRGFWLPMKRRKGKSKGTASSETTSMSNFQEPYLVNILIVKWQKETKKSHIVAPGKVYIEYYYPKL